jgi:hypothetical protein
MPSRDTALKALLARVRYASDKEEPGVLLSEEARQEAAELAAQTNPDQDIEAAALLGMFTGAGTWPSPRPRPSGPIASAGPAGDLIGPHS